MQETIFKIKINRLKKNSSKMQKQWKEMMNKVAKMDLIMKKEKKKVRKNKNKSLIKIRIIKKSLRCKRKKSKKNSKINHKLISVITLPLTFNRIYLTLSQ